MEEIRPLRPEPLIAALVEHEVEFIVIGGYAVAAHGFVRATKDEFATEFDLEPDLEGLRAGDNGP